VNGVEDGYVRSASSLEAFARMNHMACRACTLLGCVGLLPEFRVRGTCKAQWLLDAEGLQF
jgi:hypothetical protein